jgi:anti-anti-sigma regulatory factor
MTGVRSFDASSLRLLGNTAQALRLVGAGTVVTGVRPAAARALVEQGIPLPGIVTKATLQSGIEYALRST